MIFAMCIVINATGLGKCRTENLGAICRKHRQENSVVRGPENFVAEILQTVPRVCRFTRQDKKSLYNKGLCVAEGVGFEPTIRFPVYTLSKRAP